MLSDYQLNHLDVDYVSINIVMDPRIMLLINTAFIDHELVSQFTFPS